MVKKIIIAILILSTLQITISKETFNKNNDLYNTLDRAVGEDMAAQLMPYIKYPIKLVEGTLLGGVGINLNEPFFCLLYSYSYWHAIFVLFKLSNGSSEF